MSNLLTVAAVQMVSGVQVKDNLRQAANLLERAAAEGAQLAVLPEYFCILGRSAADKLPAAEADGYGEIQEFLAEQAQRLRLAIVAGSVPLKSPIPGKVFNSCLVYGAEGQRLMRYDKIHLFALDYQEQQFDEGQTIVAGSNTQAFQLAVDEQSWKIGLSICYDLRFPELYRALSPRDDPCDLLLVPSAFTYVTGKAHWEILLRARAIENQCYVLAAAQGGIHENGRRTWGQSMFVEPWGAIEQQLAQDEGIVMGQVERTKLAEIRARLPALRHRVM